MISCYANQDEIKEYAKANGLDYTKTRYAQVCYLYHVIGEKRAKIAEITGYAVSTLSSLKKKVYAFIETAKNLFSEIAATITPKEKKIETVSLISKLPNCGEDRNGAEKSYLFKFYDVDGYLLFSKIGTTKRSCDKRIREEVNYYNKHGFSIGLATICRIVDCGNIPAESYESYLRAVLIKEYPGTWKKNDRFFGVDIPIETFDTLCNLFEKIQLNGVFGVLNKIRRKFLFILPIDKWGEIWYNGRPACGRCGPNFYYIMYL